MRELPPAIYPEATIHTSAAWFTLPNGLVILQRRPTGGRESDLLSLYGGKSDVNELPIDTIVREVGEETDLHIEREQVGPGNKLFIPKSVTGRDNLILSVFRIPVPDVFESHDGIPELHAIHNLPKRTDATVALRSTLQHRLWEDKDE